MGVFDGWATASTIQHIPQLSQIANFIETSKFSQFDSCPSLTPGCIVEYDPPSSGQQSTPNQKRASGSRNCCANPLTHVLLSCNTSHASTTLSGFATHMPAAASSVLIVRLHAAGGRVVAKILLLKTTRNILVIKSPKRATKSATSCAHTSTEVALRTSCPVWPILMMGTASANVL